MDTETSKLVYPLAHGDFIIRVYDNQIARVRSIYWVNDQYSTGFLMNLSMYRWSGIVAGRMSPACGGPRDFEPAIPFHENEWKRIEKPNFPIASRVKGVLDENTGKYIYREQPYLDYLPFRKIVRVKKKSPTNKPKVIENFDLELEIRAMRIAANKLRDLARTTNSEEIKQEAVKIEQEIDRLLTTA
jgi:hypothetical protein